MKSPKAEIVRLVKIINAVWLAVILFTGCASAQNQAENKPAADLSTDEAVIAELQKIKDAKNAALTGEDEKIAAKRRAIRLDAGNVCIKRFKESVRVIVIGAFRYDYGCHFEGAFVDSRFYDATDIEIHRNALEAFGWQKANRTEREKLAGFWVEKGLLAFFTVLKTNRKIWKTSTCPRRKFQRRKKAKSKSRSGFSCRRE